MTKKFKDLIRRKDNLWYVKYARVPFTGVVEKFHNDGLLASKHNYKDGEPHGLWEMYWSNGHLQQKGNYKDGKKHGLCEYYWSNGQLAVSYTHLTLPTTPYV